MHVRPVCAPTPRAPPRRPAHRCSLTACRPCPCPCPPATGLPLATGQQQTTLPPYQPLTVVSTASGTASGCVSLPDAMQQLLALLPAPGADQLCPILLNGIVPACDLLSLVGFGVGQFVTTLECDPAGQVGWQQGRAGAAWWALRTTAGGVGWGAPHHARQPCMQGCPPIPRACFILPPKLKPGNLPAPSFPYPTPHLQVNPPPGSALAPLPDRRPLPAGSFADVSALYAAEGATYSW